MSIHTWYRGTVPDGRRWGAAGGQGEGRRERRRRPGAQSARGGVGVHGCVSWLPYAKPTTHFGSSAGLPLAQLIVLSWEAKMHVARKRCGWAAWAGVRLALSRAPLAGRPEPAEQGRRDRPEGMRRFMTAFILATILQTVMRCPVSVIACAVATEFTCCAGGPVPGRLHR